MGTNPQLPDRLRVDVGAAGLVVQMPVRRIDDQLEEHAGDVGDVRPVDHLVEDAQGARRVHGPVALVRQSVLADGVAARAERDLEAGDRTPPALTMSQR